MSGEGVANGDIRQLQKHGRHATILSVQWHNALALVFPLHLLTHTTPSYIGSFSLWEGASNETGIPPLPQRG